MKTVILVLLSALTLNLFATVHDSTADLLGNFEEPTMTFIIGYEDASACSNDNGDWDAEMEMCFFNTENTIEVSANANGLFLSIATVGSNAHQCYFEGSVTKTTSSSLISEVESMVWNGDDYVPGKCIVTATYENADTVSVSTNGQCQEYCGARAWLEFGPATRK